MEEPEPTSLTRPHRREKCGGQFCSSCDVLQLLAVRNGHTFPFADKLPESTDLATMERSQDAQRWAEGVEKHSPIGTTRYELCVKRTTRHSQEMGRPSKDKMSWATKHLCKHYDVESVSEEHQSTAR